MLLAVLYSAEDTILAVAMACDQQAVGDPYWLDVQGVQLPGGIETAYIDLDDADLADRLLDLENEFVDGQHAAIAVEQYLNNVRSAAPEKRQAA